MSKPIHSLSLFDRVAQFLKRLSLDTDVNREEGVALAAITDDLNVVRENYVDRKIEEMESCEPSEI